MADMVICGLSLEQELIDEGLIQVGHCTDCWYLDWCDSEHYCIKKDIKVTKMKTDCKDWFVDIR